MERNKVINTALIGSVVALGTILAAINMPESKSAKMVQKQVAVVERHGFFTST